MNPEMGYGGERAFVYLAEEFARLGHDVYVFSQRGTWIPNCKIVYVSGYPSATNDIFAEAIESYDVKFDVVVLQDDVGFWRIPRIQQPYFFFAHGYKFPADKFCKSVVTASCVVGKKIVSVDNTVIPIGVDGKKFVPAKDKSDYYVWLGKVWHSGIKPLHYVVEAVCARQEKMFICAVIEDWKYFDEKVKPLIDGKNIILAQNVCDDKKIDILGKAKALLSAQGYVETFGINHIEAFACGTPVIYNDPVDRFTEHSPIYYYGNNDVALRIEGSKDLSKKFAEKMGDIKPEMFRQAREHFEKNFDISIVAAKWLEMFAKKG